MKQITYGTRELNKLLDDTLMLEKGFASETLMELAGLAVAQVANKILKRHNHEPTIANESICVLVGPGNNGGDGLVAARHLKMMQYNVDIVQFKTLEGKNGNYFKQCLLNGISSRSLQWFEQGDQVFSTNIRTYLSTFTLIIDAIFGFPFTGQLRQPYKQFLLTLQEFETKILSVDIPSGWDANEGNIHHLFVPRYLVSLGIPKMCSKEFKGEHYCGGRFIPEAICSQLGIVLPNYQNDALYMRIDQM